MITLNVNNTEYTVDAEPGELLVWVINEKIGLTNTRFGCGMEMCGACKVMVDDQVVRSCVIKVRDVLGSRIVTSEQQPEIREM